MVGSVCPFCQKSDFLQIDSDVDSCGSGFSLLSLLCLALTRCGKGDWLSRVCVCRFPIGAPLLVSILSWKFL